MSNLTLHPQECPLCGSAGKPTLHLEANIEHASWNTLTFSSRKNPEHGHYRLEHCRLCDVIYANPAPFPDDLATEYLQASYESQREATMASHTYGRLLDQIAGRLPGRRGAVDIGTGEGSFLVELQRRGFESIKGVEPSAAPRRCATPEIRPLIHAGVFREGLYPPSSQDLVTCFQTIEHLPDPLSVCREANRILRPGGVLMIVAHNHRAVSRLILGAKSPIYDVEHLQLFSPGSLRRLLRRSGFRENRVRPIANRYPVSYWAKLVPWPSTVQAKILTFIDATALGACDLPLWAGNLMAVGFKPS